MTAFHSCRISNIQYQLSLTSSDDDMNRSDEKSMVLMDSISMMRVIPAGGTKALDGIAIMDMATRAKVAAVVFVRIIILVASLVVESLQKCERRGGRSATELVAMWCWRWCRNCVDN